ncbi:protein serine/threonine phosphatase [Thalassoporum mexicanum PCC 7367]|uniref:SpoIIE family protein phosphatase n=1 Tax=Thalassoporum mexicanum TaxID=3457544 RepID=UPI00029FABA5|nr:SpoIIE family protein phosphatase [Pseudanabaena sp. PCC 7367]AFY70800.1 protein serine/threonine phosphatase [Pseudanabaena sp. PCC 7367]
MSKTISQLWQSLIKLLQRRVVLVLTIFFCIGAIGVLLDISMLSSSLIESQALENAKLSAEIMAEARTLYSAAVVSRLEAIDGLKISHDYDQQENTVPLPATYLIELSSRIRELNQGMSFRLYSAYPFPWREDEGGARDSFEQEAWKFLIENPTQVYYRTDVFRGRKALRYAQADLMKPSCVSCHNSHPQSPKTDWQVGDVRGVLEVTQPLDVYIAKTNDGLTGTIAIMAVSFGIGFAGLYLAIRRLRANSRDLSDRVKERTQDLALAYDEISQLNQRLQAENIQMESELAVTARLQELILPKEEELAQVEKLDIAAFIKPADRVGGDYYDVLPYGKHLIISVGDVTGHGLESGMLMLMVQSAVRTMTNSEDLHPREFISILNRVIYQNTQRMGSKKFMTLLMLHYVDNSLCLTGQHEEMILVRRDGLIEFFDTVDLGFPIGLEEEISQFVDHSMIEFNPGDVAILYTDGITEAENNDCQQYGIDQLAILVRENREHEAATIKEMVIADWCQFVGDHQVYDDVTLLVIKQK